MKTHFNRRMFIGTAGAGVLVVPGRSGRAAPSERVRIAVIGLRNRGTDLTRLFAANPDAELVAVCDVDDSMFDKPVTAVEKIAKKPPRIEKDFRRLLDDKSIDAVAIATPDHWHALMTVMACQAGKDVYVEKPASHNVVEGRRMVEAARRHGRVVQMGTQSRSTTHVRDAIDHVRSGALGKVAMARAWGHQKRRKHWPSASRDRSPRAWTTSCGKGQRPIGRFTRIGFITSGTGSGTGGPVSSVTTGFMAWMSLVGAWASTRPPPCAREEASTYSTTTKRRRTRKSPLGNFPTPAWSGNTGSGPTIRPKAPCLASPSTGRRGH